MNKSLKFYNLSLSAVELDECKQRANDIYKEGNIGPNQAYAEALLVLLMKKGYIKPDTEKFYSNGEARNVLR